MGFIVRIWNMDIIAGDRWQIQNKSDSGYIRSNKFHVFFRRIQIPLEVSSKTGGGATNRYSRQYLF